MSLAKTCHANNMMQDIKSNLWAYCNRESFLNRGVSIFQKRCSTNKSDICSTLFCCEFRQLHFCQILFKLVFISHCYHESHRGELFLKQCGHVTVPKEISLSLA